GEGEAADRRARRLALVETGVEHGRPVLPRDDEERVWLDRLVDHPAGGRGCRQAGVEGAEVEAGARGEVEPYAGARGNKLERRPDPRAAFGVAHDLEPGRLTRLLGGGEQRFELRRRQRPAGRRFDARLESEDRLARSLAEVAVAHAIVESQPHERVLRGP